MTVIFKNDILIMHNDSGVSRDDICYAISSAIFFLSFYGFIAFGILVNHEFFGILPIPILLYMVLSCLLYPNTKYIKHTRTLTETHENV